MSEFEFDFSGATAEDAVEFVALVQEIRSEETLTRLFSEFGKFPVRSDLFLRTCALVEKFSVKPLGEIEIMACPELVSSFSHEFTLALIERLGGCE